MSTPQLAEQGAHIVDQAGDSAEKALNATQRGIDAVRESSKQWLSRAQSATDNTTGFIKEEPVKAVLIAAATGAALMGLIALLARRRD
jgi:ElaB/YqjD/DUF883 family membrane-anchored ribosome-binding protein